MGRNAKKTTTHKLKQKLNRPLIGGTCRTNSESVCFIGSFDVNSVATGEISVSTVHIFSVPAFSAADFTGRGRAGGLQQL